MSRTSVWGLDPATYQRHSLHHESRAWVEKNCYVDVWLEVLHAAKLDPTPALAFTLASDFDGEQWTFYKPAHTDLHALFGVGVQELNAWKPLLEHTLFHARQGRLIMTEADSFYLPDTQGTDYRTQHVKSTIAIEMVDVEKQQLGYFHNASYWVMEGEDYVKTLRLDTPADAGALPLFAELVRFDRAMHLPDSELLLRSTAQLKTWLARRPTSNPLRRLGQYFADQLELIRSRGLPYYHGFAFSTMRQLGSGYELSAEYLRWLERLNPKGYEAAARGFEEISNATKTLVLKGARAANSKKPVDFTPVFEEMAVHWDVAMSTLDSLT